MMKIYFTLIVFVFAMSYSFAQDSKSAPPPENRKVFFGEQHLHTQASPDAYAFGTRNTAKDAYDYAKGKPVKNSTNGQMQQKRTPFDWIAVTDHAEYYGVMPQLSDPNSEFMKKYKDMPLIKDIQSGDEARSNKAFGQIASSLTYNEPIAAFNDNEIMKNSWDEYKKVTNDYYEPGKFTTLIAFEWTSIPVNQNLHRNVFFRDNEGPIIPFSAMDSDRPEDLWTYLETWRKSGKDNFAIPHNGNISNGLMYAPRTSYGTPIDALYASRRIANEPATEIIQIKSASETHPALSPNDEFAAFETWFKHLIGSSPATVSRVNYGYVREALINGVGYQEYLGVNPFKYGIVGGSDVHDATSTNEEDSFAGGHGRLDDTPKKRIAGGANLTGEAPYNLASAGLTAVWADENTREGIFDGIKRKETYGTSGTFIRLRFFGGWGYEANLDKDTDYVYSVKSK